MINKIVTTTALATLALAFASCSTARSLGDAAGSAVRATGNVVGDTAQGAVDATKSVGGAVGQDLKTAGQTVSDQTAAGQR